MTVSHLIITLLVSFSTVVSQPPQKDFDSLTEQLISTRPRSYRALEQAFMDFRRDTVLMRRFLVASQEADYHTGVSFAYNRLGITSRNQSEFSKAVRFHQQGLEAALKADNMELRIFSLNMLGVVYRRNDAVRAALDYNQEALALAESIKNPSEAIKRSINIALNSIGNIYKTLDQYELAQQYFRRSLALEQELDNDMGVAVNLENLGECMEELGVLDEAMEYYMQSLDYNNRINSERGIAICKNSMARIHIKQGNPEKAPPLLQEAWDVAAPLNYRNITTDIKINRGWAATRLGLHEEAEDYLDEGLEDAIAYNLPMKVVNARLKLSDLYQKTGNYEKALRQFKLAKEEEEQVKNELNLSYVNDMIIRYDTEKKIDQIQMLAQENEIVKLKLKRNENAQLVSLLLLSLFSLIFYILYRQYQLNSDKKMLTLEQSMLRSQMNPHFLFNSLNSIKLFIINNEKKNAVHYLNKFSKLVRKILEASSVREITLAEELETVALYMNIENIRFNHEIHFEITVDNDIDPEEVRIPSLILQPFLENAIWHGLSSKEGKKEVLLHVTGKDDSYITLSITDNGVGRRESEKLKQNRVLKRKSVGIDITRERLANFSKGYENNFSLEIEDLYDEDGKAQGTRVLLYLPTR